MNLHKFKHFYINKYIVSKFKSERYFISYDYKHKALWFRTYKVASRSIDAALKQGSSKNQYIYGSEMSYIPSQFKSYFKFAFVREPSERFLSAWKDKVLRSNYFNLSDKEHKSLQNIDNFIDWTAQLDINKCDEHLRSQAALVDTENIDFLGRFENLEEDFEFLLRKLDISNFQIPHMNKGISKNFELTEDQMTRLKSIYEDDYREFYS